MPRWILRVAVALIVLCAPRAAAADPEPMPSPHLRLTSGDGVLHVGDREVLVPHDSHVLAPDAWSALDAELHRLQDREVRLDAENHSLRDTAKSWQPGWKTLLGAVVAGISIGAYAAHRL